MLHLCQLYQGFVRPSGLNVSTLAAPLPRYLILFVRQRLTALLCTRGHFLKAMDERAYGAILDAVYAAPLAPERWSEVLERLCTLLGGGERVDGQARRLWWRIRRTLAH